MKLVFWQPIPSFHQEGFFNALVDADWVDEVELKVEQELPLERIEQGWRKPDFSRIKVELIKDKEVPEDDPDTIHFFTGYFTHQKIWNAFLRNGHPSQSRYYAYAEAPELIGWKGILRFIKYRIQAFRFGQKLDGILALGDLGKSFYQRIAPRTPVYSFGYFNLLQNDFPKLNLQTPNRPYTFLYVGQMIHRKGVDRLLKALTSLPNDLNWQLNLIGSGPKQNHLKKLGNRLGMEDRLNWQDSMPAKDLKAFFLTSDCVVLPSRWDGWGMLINEGLQWGCDVLASSLCGGSSFLNEDQVLPEKDSEWTHAFQKYIEKGVLSTEQRRKNQVFGRRFSGEAGVGLIRDYGFVNCDC